MKWSKAKVRLPVFLQMLSAQYLFGSHGQRQINDPHLNIFSGLVLESKGSLLKVTYSKVKVKLLVLAPIDVCFTISLKIY